MNRKTERERQQGEPGGREEARGRVPPKLSMQPVPGCRIRVWKKEWQQTVGSQTSLTTGTRRIANRNEQRSRDRKKERTERKEVGGGKERRLQR